MSSKQKLPADVIRVRRSGARLAAVQALYQLEVTERSAKSKKYNQIKIKIKKKI